MRRGAAQGRTAAGLGPRSLAELRGCVRAPSLQGAVSLEGSLAGVAAAGVVALLAWGLSLVRLPHALVD